MHCVLTGRLSTAMWAMGSVIRARLVARREMCAVWGKVRRGFRGHVHIDMHISHLTPRWVCVFISFLNPLFEALSTTSGVFCDLHKAPAQFDRSRGDIFPLSSAPIWTHGIALDQLRDQRGQRRPYWPPFAPWVQ
jgi:hypothetical protein